jgi:hypothetical protein
MIDTINPQNTNMSSWNTLYYIICRFLTKLSVVIIIPILYDYYITLEVDR